jgi:hypothetical protein
VTTTLTLKMLRDWDACDAAIARFERLFGSEVEVTAKAVRRWRRASRARQGGQDPGWVIWFALCKRRYMINQFCDHVDARGFVHATRVVGNYPARRCAEAIRQVLEAVADD